MPCPDCGGYMKKVPKINKRDDMEDDKDYYRCVECGTEQTDDEYFDSSRTEPVNDALG